MKLSGKVTIPIGVLLFGMIAGTGLVAVQPSVETAIPEVRPPLVRTTTAKLETVTLRVRAQGTVAPRTESNLVAEVSGRITWVSPRLASGGFIKDGEVLVRIDSRDYRVGLRRAEAAVERAASELSLARSNLERNRNLNERGVASAAALEDARNRARVSEAVQWDATASLEQARSDLERTEITAPFVGRVREKHVDVGQFVSRGAALARVYAVDYAEIRLPIPDRVAALANLPIGYEDESSADALTGPRVRLRAQFGGGEFEWEGRIVRTEGEIDPRTRMINVIARVENPYSRGDDPNRPPLAVGLFVDAEIEGREVDGVVILPGRALRGHDQIVIVDSDDRLRLRKVQILQRDRDRVLIQGGVTEGERIVTSPLPVSVDGMVVEVEASDPEPLRADRQVQFEPRG